MMVTSGLFWFLRRRSVPVAVAVNTPLNPNAKTRLGSGRLTIRRWVASWGTPITVWWKKIRPRVSAGFACTCHCILSTSRNGSARGADMLSARKKEGLLGEHEEISVLRARKRWYEQRSREALQYRRAKGAARKRANRLARMPRDRQVYEMTCWLKKTLPADELYGYSKDKLEQLAVRHLYQLELSLNPSPPH